MAQDDMHVVMYKILAYLYACMKEGIKPSKSVYSAERLGINEPYWSNIISELNRREFIKGITVTATTAGEIVHLGNVRITMDGVEFLMENSMMAKARAFLIDIKAAVPFI